MAKFHRIQNELEDTLQLEHSDGSNLEIVRFHDEKDIRIVLNDQHGETVSAASIEPVQLAAYLRDQGFPLDAA